MEQVNRFLKGVKKFKDFSMYSNDEWTFPSLNIRILNKNDKGYIVTFLESSENVFSISSGMIVTGAAEYNGIVYITSAKTDNSGIGEIGCYPSPKWDGTSGFENNYKPLKIFDITPVSNLTTVLLNYKTNWRTDIILKETSNTSVNLYITDGNNPIHVINSGFSKDGIATGYTITAEMFGGALNLIPTTSIDLVASLFDIGDGGMLEPGTYYAFLGYVTSDYAYTTFKSSVYPIVIGSGNTTREIQGLPNKDMEGNQNISSKKFIIEVDENSLDISYEYIRVAIIRYFSNEFGNIGYESYLVSSLFNINDLKYKQPAIVITGYEEKQSFAIEEILIPNTNYTICKTHTQSENRYFGGNWSKLNYSKEAMLAYAALIKPNFDCSHEMEDFNRFQEYEYSFNEQIGQYRNVEDVESNLGYFRGEIYPFAVKGILRDGSETDECFPICGADMLDPTAIVYETSNVTGLVRFPKWVDYGNVGNQNFIMGITFDNDDAINIIGDYDFTNIVGFKIVRGDRIENLLYQGLSFPVSKGRADFMINPGIRVPAYSMTEYLPNVYKRKNKRDNSYIWNYNFFQTDLDEDYLAVFSPDLMFEPVIRNSELSNVVCEQMIRFDGLNINTSYNSASIQVVKYRNGTPINRSPNYLCFDFNSKYNTITNVSYPAGKEVIDSMYKIDDAVYNGPDGLSSLIADYKMDSSKVFYYNFSKNDDFEYEYFSRSLKFPRYIGLQGSSIGLTQSIVNIYLSDNNVAFYQTIQQAFDPKSITYFSLGYKYDLDESMTLSGRNIFYKGDCFLQRTWFRIVTNFGFGDNGIATDPYDNVSVRYGHGVLVSVITENKYNTAMRNEVQAVDPDNPNSTFYYKFYPSISPYTANEWVIPDIANKIYEAFALNFGYNKNDGLIRSYGVDRNILLTNNRQPTRIRFSDKQLNEALIDSYRRIGVSSYQDYDIKNGEIVSLKSILTFLISVQERATNQHFLGTKEMAQSVSSSDVVLQSSNVFLHDKVKPLGQIGSQHQFSVISTPTSIFGVDYDRKSIWAVIFGEGGELMQKDIGIEGEIQGHLLEIFDTVTSDRKITDKLVDDTLNGLGIHSGYNPKYKEIVFTFLFNDVLTTTILNQSLQNYRPWADDSEFGLGTITYYDGIWYYSLTSDQHTGVEPPEVPNEYSELPEEFNVYEHSISNGLVAGQFYYSYVYGIAFYYIDEAGNGGSEYGELAKYLYIDSELLNALLVTHTNTKKSIMYSEESRQWICETTHNCNLYFPYAGEFHAVLDDNKVYDFKSENVLQFFGQQQEGIISFIVNGKEAIDIVKEFMNYEIDMPNVSLYKLAFESDYQKSELSLPTTDFWLSPEYLENKLCGPIPMNNLLKQEYEVESAIKGYWLKMSIYYNQNQSTFIRKIITYFNQSFI